MDENKLPEQQPEDQWLTDFLAAHKHDLEANEEAIADTEPVDPSDSEIDKIIAQALSENWNEDVLASEPVQPEPEPFKDDEFRDTFGEGEELKQVFSNQPMPKAEPAASDSEPAEENAEEDAKPVEKGRPKKKKGYGLLGLPHLAATVVWLLIIVAIGVTVGRMVWVCAADVLGFGREPISVTLTIEESDTIDTIAEKLKDAGLIKYPGLFKFYADLTDAAEDIRPGSYTLNPPDAEEESDKNIVYDYMALVSVISPHSSGLTVVDDLRIPEGYTCAQIFQLLEENNVCTVAELEEYAANGELNEYWFLDGVARGDKYCLEGYLFPDTYDFYENDDPERVLEKMLNAFDASFTDVMRDDLAALNDRLADMMRANGYGTDYIEKHLYTIREVVIIASMIEKETANNAESYTISSVIYNRLTDASEFPYLNIDAALVYALDGKSDLTEEDKKLDSPYNTYLHAGLIPGPISNPSQNSIAAALDPEDTDYCYYAYDPETEEHHFSTNYKDHLAFLATLEDGE